MKGYGLIILLFLIVIFVCLMSAYYGPNIIELFTAETKKYNKKMIITKDKPFNKNTNKILVNMKSKNVNMSIEITDVVFNDIRGIQNVVIKYTIDICYKNGGHRRIKNKDNDDTHELSAPGDAFISLVEADIVPTQCSAGDMDAKLFVLNRNGNGELKTGSPLDVKVTRFTVENDPKNMSVLINKSDLEGSANSDDLRAICTFLDENKVKHTVCPSKEKAVKKTI